MNEYDGIARYFVPHVTSNCVAIWNQKTNVKLDSERT
jgi:hypothetical protein